MMECNVPVTTELWEARGQEIQVLRGQEIQTQIGSWAVGQPECLSPHLLMCTGNRGWRAQDPSGWSLSGLKNPSP